MLHVRTCAPILMAAAIVTTALGGLLTLQPIGHISRRHVSVATNGQYAFVTTTQSYPTGPDGLDVYDLSNDDVRMIATLRRAATVVTPSVVYAASQRFLFGSATGGVGVYDISDPVHTNFIGQLSISGLRSFRVFGDRAFAVTSTGILVFDLAAPGLPTALFTIPIVDARDIASAGDRAFIVGGTVDAYFLGAYDATAFPAVEIIDSVSLLDLPKSVFVIGTRVNAVCTGGILSYGTWNDATARLGLLRTETGSPVLTGEGAGDLGILARGPNAQSAGSQLLQNVGGVIQSASGIGPPGILDVAAANNVAVAIAPSTFSMRRIREPDGVLGAERTQPVAYKVTSVQVEAPFAFAASNGDFIVADISMPRAPLCIGGIEDVENLDTIYGVRLPAVYTDAGIVDVDDPLHPTVVAPSPFDGEFLGLVGDFVVTRQPGSSTAYRLWDVSYPLVPVRSTSHDVGGLILGLGGTRLLVRSGSELRALDVSDPRNPRLIGTREVSAPASWAIMGDHFALTGAAGLIDLDSAVLASVQSPPTQLLTLLKGDAFITYGATAKAWQLSRNGPPALLWETVPNSVSPTGGAFAGNYVVFSDWIGSIVELLIAGDMNGDLRPDFFDIDNFVLAVIDPDAFRAQNPFGRLLNADINGDGRVDFFDIDPFVELLLNR